MQPNVYLKIYKLLQKNLKLVWNLTLFTTYTFLGGCDGDGVFDGLPRPFCGMDWVDSTALVSGDSALLGETQTWTASNYDCQQRTTYMHSAARAHLCWALRDGRCCLLFDFASVFPLCLSSSSSSSATEGPDFFLLPFLEAFTVGSSFAVPPPPGGFGGRPLLPFFGGLFCSSSFSNRSSLSLFSSGHCCSSDSEAVWPLFRPRWPPLGLCSCASLVRSSRPSFSSESAAGVFFRLLGLSNSDWE